MVFSSALVNIAVEWLAPSFRFKRFQILRADKNHLWKLTLKLKGHKKRWKAKSFED
jgi:hypothetical protein